MFLKRDVNSLASSSNQHRKAVETIEKLERRAGGDREATYKGRKNKEKKESKSVEVTESHRKKKVKTLEQRDPLWWKCSQSHFLTSVPCLICCAEVAFCSIRLFSTTLYLRGHLWFIWFCYRRAAQDNWRQTSVVCFSIATGRQRRLACHITTCVCVCVCDDFVVNHNFTSLKRQRFIKAIKGRQLAEINATTEIDFLWLRGHVWVSGGSSFLKHNYGVYYGESVCQTTGTASIYLPLFFISGFVLLMKEWFALR